MLRPLALLALAAVLAACAEPSPSTSSPSALDAAETPAIALTAAGPVTAWVHADSASGETVLLVRAARAETPVTVARGGISAHTQAGPRLAILADGALGVAWVEEEAVEGRRFPASSVRLARSDDGGATWGAAVRASPDPGFPTGQTFHSLAVAPDGTILVAWLDGTARERFDRASATPPAHAGHATAPARADPTGEDHTAHAADAAPGTDLVVARSTDGGRTFEPPVTVARGTCQCCRTALAVAPDGTVYAVWRHIFDGDQRDMAVARSADGGATFSPLTRVHRDGWALDGCPHAGPAAAVASDGALHVAWPTGADGTSGLWHAVSRDGGASFAAPTPLARGPLGQVRAASGADGRVWLAWEEAAHARIGLVAAGTTDTLRVDGAAPDLAAGPSGWTLAWLDGRTLQTRAGS